MTTPDLAKDIGHDEGLRLRAYPDPDSGAAPWTVGYGCTGAGIGPDTVWTQAQADDELATRIQQVQSQLDLALPWWRTLNDARQDVLVNMAYNLGVRGLCEFGRTLDAVRVGHWATVRADLLASAWAKQVRGRAVRLAEQMLTGVRVAP
jgi:lysozyme